MIESLSASLVKRLSGSLVDATQPAGSPVQPSWMSWADGTLMIWADGTQMKWSADNG